MPHAVLTAFEGDIFYYTYQTILGPMTITCSETSLLAVGFGSNQPPMIKDLKRSEGFMKTNPKHPAAPLNVRVARTPLTDLVFQQLQEYFQKRRRVFDVPLHMTGTRFQKQVWHALLDIPYGETRSYGEIAASIGNPNAARAVGMANHCNPIAIIIPCHRVIGANGRLTGYASGLEIKKRLLELENDLQYLKNGNHIPAADI